MQRGTSEQKAVRVAEAGPPRAEATAPRRWRWLLLVAVLALVGYWLRARSQPPGGAPGAHPAMPPVPVTVATARTGDMPIVLSGLGSVVAFNTATVKSRVDGQIVRVAFEEGQLVHEGDLLAEIDPRPFAAQLSQAEGQLARDVAQLKVANLTLARYRDLIAQGVIAKQDFDNQAAQVGQFEGAIKADQAQIDTAKLQLTYARVTAPISGRAGLRQVDTGNVVHANDQNGLVVITQLQPIAVLFRIPEDDLPATMAKLTAGEHLPVEAYDRDGRKKLAAGTLLTADNQIDASTGTIRLKAVFPNDDGALFPNQFVNIALQLDVRKGAVIIPVSAVQRGPQGTFAYVVKPDHTVEVRPLTLGTTQGADAAVDTGLAANDVVVVNGVDKLRAGSAVQVRTPEGEGAAPRPGG
jgi:multidrug efflux system membrane fusion protein